MSNRNQPGSLLWRRNRCAESRYGYQYSVLSKRYDAGV